MLNQHQILVSVDALYTLIKAINGNGVELREIIATKNLPDLPSLQGNPNPIKILSDALDRFCEKKGHYKPIEMFFVLENDNELVCNTGGTTKVEAVLNYKTAKGFEGGEVNPEASVISATVLLDDESKVNINSLPAVEYNDKDYVAAVMKLASESTFYKNSNEQMFRIDACDEDKGWIHVINENSELAFVGVTVFAEFVKSTDVFYKTHPVLVSDAVKSYMVKKEEEDMNQPVTEEEIQGHRSGHLVDLEDDNAI